MTDREAVHRLLTTYNPLTGIPSYPGWVTDKQPPYVTIFRVSKVRNRTLQGDTGLYQSRFQIDVWAGTQAECDRIVGHVTARLHDYSGTVGQVIVRQSHVDTEQDFPEPPVASGQPLFRQSLELLFWWEQV